MLSNNMKSPAGRLRRMSRRGLAFLLVAIMIITSPLPGLSFPSYAAGDPPLVDDTDNPGADWQHPGRPAYPKDKGGSDTTAYYYQQQRASYAGAFNIQGIKNPALVGAENPWVDGEDYEGAVQTTRGSGGYSVYINKDGVGETKLDIPHNGYVKDLSGNYGLQAKMRVYPSPIGSEVVVDYILHNTQDVSNDVKIGTTANIRLGGGPIGPDYNPQIDPADASRLEINPRGFHMVNSETKQTFELITNDADLGCTPPTTNWVGYLSDLLFNKYMNSKVNYTLSGDSALAYSWSVHMEPYQTVTRRVAFKVGTASYYVSKNGDDNGSGDFTSPFRTIEKAMTAIRQTPLNTDKVGNVYLQSDYELDHMVFIDPALIDGFKITLSSTDYDRAGLPSNRIYRITRAPGFTGPMTKLSGHNSLELKNLTVDGTGTQPSQGPFVLAQGSSGVTVSRGATLENNTMEGANTGSAIEVSEQAGLNLEGGVITNNSGGCGAISFDGSGQLLMRGSVLINGNTNGAGKKGNVCLASGKHITVTGNMAGSNVGVTARDVPQLSSDGTALDPNQEVIVAVPKDETVAPANKPSPFAPYFFADQAGEQPYPGLYTGAGNLAGHKETWVNTVLRRNSSEMSFHVQAAEGAPAITNPPAIPAQRFEAGSSVTAPGAPEITGYKLDHTDISQGDSASLIPSADGSVTGIMPNQAVTVTYYYREIRASIAFHTNGGMPDTIDRWEGQVGKPTGKPMPAVSKSGYVFKGWSKENKGSGSAILPASFFDTYPNDEAEVYAIFTPDTTVKFHYEIKHTTGDERIVIGSSQGQYSAEEPVTGNKIDVKGYLWDQNGSRSDPASIGSFAADGSFNGTMPNRDTALYYHYKPDATRYTLTVNYVSENGAKLAEPSITQHPAEEPVHASPQPIPAHYAYSTYRFDKGTSSEETADGRVYGVQENPGADGVWAAAMPNQDVTLTYIYKGDGAETSKFRLTENYTDEDTSDSALKNIKTQSGLKLVDEKVNGAYEEQYGYLPSYPFPAPATAAPSGTNIAFGSEADQGKWTGVMPAGDVTITYKNHRDTAKWASVTYKAGAHGSLYPDGQSADLKAVEGAAGEFRADVLKNDTADPLNAPYSFGDMTNKKLIPKVRTDNDTLYYFAGWFEDKNDNGVMDAGEDVKLNSVFNGNTTLTASFKENADAWLDVRLSAKNGTLGAYGVSDLHVPVGTTWGAIKGKLPDYTPWAGYKKDGWYDGGNAMKDSDVLSKDKTYTAVSISDPVQAKACTVQYENEDGSVIFSARTELQNIETPITAVAMNVPGYEFDQAGSYTDPPEFNFNQSDPHAKPESTGSFTADGHFSGKMPGLALTVHFRYKVSTKPDAPKYTLTVKYESNNGATLRAPVVIPDLQPGAEINQPSPAIDHYTCELFKKTAGWVSHPDEGIQGVKDDPVKAPSPGSGYTWNAKMPNQDVTLIYLYGSDGAETSKFRLTENYTDEDTSDSALKNIKTQSGLKLVDEKVNGAYEAQYGYLPSYPFPAPATAAPSGANIAFGSEADQGKWTGVMPAGDVTITYKNHRDTAKWASVTYKAGAHGSLYPDGQSADLKAVEGAAGEFRADVLKNDTADPLNAPYSFGDMTNKKLIPKVRTDNDTLYYFAGWFEDKNNNGVMDAGEDVKLNSVFNGNTTLTASFKENADAWLDVRLSAKNGTLGAYGVSDFHVPAGTTWGAIKGKLPDYTPWAGYKKDGWYDGGNAMKDSDVLSKDKTYTAVSISDPAQEKNYIVQYENGDGSLIFKTEAAVRHTVEAAVEADKLNVPGYEFDKAASYTDPPSYNFDKDHPELLEEIGTFGDNGHFSGKMPFADLTVHYRYRVNASPDAGKFKLTIQYHSASGAVLKADDVTELKPETEFTKNSPEIGHYTCNDIQKVAGWTADPDTGIRAMQGEPEPKGTAPDVNGYTWSGRMPNQDVTLTYIYTGNGGTDPSSRFKITETYMDETNPDDIRLLSASERTEIPVDTPVNGQFESSYGYTGKPEDFKIELADHSVETGLAFGTGSDAGRWSGYMPASDVTITYYCVRNTQPGDKNWAALTYQKDGHGTLSSTSRDVTEETAGEKYSAQILVSDGTAEGNKGAYTWKTLKAKSLIPTATPEDKHYQFSGWYLDANGNGKKDAEDTVSLGMGDDTDTAEQDARIFDGPASLVASFTEIPDQWIDIRFMAEKAAPAEGSKPESLHIQADKSFGDLMDGHLLPVYVGWPSYKEEGWFERPFDSTSDSAVDRNSALHDKATYINRFIPDQLLKYNYTKNYKSDSGIVFKTEDSGGGLHPEYMLKIEDPVTAAPLTIPGYRLHTGMGGTNINPQTYPFVPGNPTDVGTFDGNLNFSGRMPGGDLTVNYVYSADPNVKFTGTIKYETENGVTLAAPQTWEKSAEEDFSASPADFDGYTCIGFTFDKGKTATDTTSEVQGEPDRDNGFHWESKMPNQDVTLVYKYKGTAGFAKTITQKYVDGAAADPALSAVRQDLQSDPTAPDTPVSGNYEPQYGYTKVSADIAYNPAAPAGADVGFVDGDKTHWSGHMPAADVTITYSHSRTEGKWGNVTFVAGANGSISNDGLSSDLKAKQGAAGQFEANVLLNDGSGAGAAATDHWTFGSLSTKGLVPSATPDNGTLYYFAGWFDDKNNNGVMDPGEEIRNNDKFTAPVTLTASFKENTGAWNNIKFASDRGTLGAVSTAITHVPETYRWSDIKDSLPSLTPWDHYTFKGWYDDEVSADTPVADNALLLNGHTYTARFVPDPDPAGQHDYVVQYENEDGGQIFKTAAAVKHTLEDTVEAEKLDVPGYVFDRAISFTDPAEYNFDKSHPDQLVAIGAFGDDGHFTGKMPYANLTVHYLYRVNQSPAAGKFKLTIQYHSANGAVLKAADVTELKPEETFTADSPEIGHYTCNSIQKVAGWTADPDTGRRAMANEPASAGETGGYTWSGRMPNQDVTLTYVYTGNGSTDPGSRFRLTEQYMDVTGGRSSLIASSVTEHYVDEKVEGEYEQPYGFEAQPPFTVTLADKSVLQSLDFGAGGDPGKWSGFMPASDVTITYNNTRIPPDPHAPAKDQWAALTYQKSGNGTLQPASQEVTEVTPGETYTTQILISDGTEAGNQNAYTWKTLKEKGLVPAATADSGYYQFSGWFIDTNNDGKVETDTDTFLGTGAENDPGDATFFTGATTLLAYFTEVPGQWIDIGFNAQNGDHVSGAESLHVEKDKTWGELQGSLPEYTPWENYSDGGWYAADTPMSINDGLADGQIYTHRFVPDPAKTFPYTVKYTNEDGSLVFKTIPPVYYSVGQPVTAAKIEVPGYVWDRAGSSASPETFKFNPHGEAAAVGTFADDGRFTGKLPGVPGGLTVSYRYKPDPEKNKFKLTIRYQSAHGATLKAADVTMLKAEEEFTKDSPAIAHFTCNSIDKVTGWTADPDMGKQAMQNEPEPVGTLPNVNGYTWSGRMPNQDVTLTYLYTGDSGDDPHNRFTLTENYVDVTDGQDRLISTAVKGTYAVDQAVSGQYEQPYGYNAAMPFEIRTDDDSVLTNLAFGTGDGADKWSGVMPASDVTVIYRNTRNLEPADPDKPAWAAMTYARTEHGTLLSASPDVTTADGGATYTAQILVSDGTPAGDANAYTWKTLKEKGLIPTATPENHYYQFAGWYIDNNGSGSVDGGDTLLGKGDGSDTPEADATRFTGKTRLLASFTEIPQQWIDIHFNVRNGDRISGSEDLHIQKDRTWDYVASNGFLPDYRAWKHYADDGWYAGDARMEGGSALVDGQTYTHKFMPDETEKFSYTTEYANEDGSVVFKTDTAAASHAIESQITASKEEVPGYIWDKAHSGTDPAAYSYDPHGPATAIGEFRDDGGFTGRMPGEDLKVTYKYKVDETRTFHLTVRYETTGGVKVAEQTGPVAYHAGDEFTTARIHAPGYNDEGFKLEAGAADEGLIKPVQGRPDAAGNWTGRMPNQDVTLVYLYKADETKKYDITVKYQDLDAPPDLKDIRVPEVLKGYRADDAVNGTYEAPNGYVFADRSITPDALLAGAVPISFRGTPDQAEGNNWNGHMPPSNVTITYGFHRKAEDWKKVTYRPGANGSLKGHDEAGSDVSQGVTPIASPANAYEAGILTGNGGYTFGDMKAKKLVPLPKPQDKYYLFDCWFVDTNDNQAMDPGLERPLMAGDTFTGGEVLVAGFKEDPEQWADISFAAGENGSLKTDRPHGLHIQADKKWKDIEGGLPTPLPVHNYLFDGWYSGNTRMTDESPIEKNQVYTAEFYPDPEVFGTKVMTPEAAGGLDSGGRGTVTVFNASQDPGSPGGQYQYILADEEGKVIKTLPMRAYSIKTLSFDNLLPGTRYQVYEALLSVRATPGAPVQGLGIEDRTISRPASVLVPVVTDNYQVDYDDGDETGNSAILTISPADPDSEYALLDAEGRVVNVPGSKEDGFFLPAPEVKMRGLGYDKPYTVVARPRGQSEIQAESRRPYGTVITSDPGGELNLTDYIVETNPGKILKVGENDVDAGHESRYDMAKRGDEVTVRAEGINSAGETFLGWKVLIGPKTLSYLNDTSSSSPEMTFQMPNSNLVLSAVYDHEANKDGKVGVVDEVRGGNRQETAINPGVISNLEAGLTQAADEELMRDNGASIDYHLVYKKGGVHADERQAVFDSTDRIEGHDQALRTAWSLKLTVERYVNGRRVELPASPSNGLMMPENRAGNGATPSNAADNAATPSDAAGRAATPSNANRNGGDSLNAAFLTYVQLGREDVDMMDYQLFAIDQDPSGSLVAHEVPLDYDPDGTGGLFSFNAKPGVRYVMAYSRAYHVYFKHNPHMTDPGLEPGWDEYGYKVRMGEAANNPEYYGDQFAAIPDPGALESDSHMIDRATGGEYWFEGWSSSPSVKKLFHPDTPVRKTTKYYVYYRNNEDGVKKERKLLEAAIENARKLSRNPFFKREDSEALLEDITNAQGTLDRSDPRRAIVRELEAARKELQLRSDYYEEALQKKYDEYSHIQSGSSGGGSGSGVFWSPFNPTSKNEYVIGTNGNWEVISAVPGQEKEMAFVLNGGKRLADTWARLRSPVGGDKSINGWYHFNSKGIMETGWFVDEAGNWYYCNKETEGAFGKMAAGWHRDIQDGRWYYLDPVSGAMKTGWQQVDGIWYYLETVGANAYVYDPVKEDWNYGGAGNGNHPLGSMYSNEATPDGYQTDQSGAWIQ